MRLLWQHKLCWRERSQNSVGSHSAMRLKNCLAGDCE
jgi:hypothetical protein